MTDLDGATVAVTVDGQQRTGTVLRTTYTAKYGQPLVAVALDEPLPDGREQYLARADTVERV
ncbi:hypothetical protein [Haloglomus halophilum]|uniref:hypothetical protein n=1 Tax=Haloglomus halophilum TaxID=2962672 RepID=UPI0020CA06E4|nr:hypothetical protein [Haloglomus halophilum]